VSNVRLSVRGLPKSIDEKQLKEVFMRAVRKDLEANVNPAIKQVKIIRSQVKNTKTEAQSRGFGFVEFIHPAAAMNAVKNTNNVPGVFRNLRNLRIYVEFAVDNVQKLNLRNEKKKKSLSRSNSVTNIFDNDNDEKKRKRSFSQSKKSGNKKSKR